MYTDDPKEVAAEETANAPETETAAETAASDTAAEDNGEGAESAD